MNKSFKSIILFILFINLFVNSSNPNGGDENKNLNLIPNEELFKASALNKEEVNLILEFFFLFLSLTHTVQSAHLILTLSGESCFSVFLNKLNNFLKLNTSFYSLIKTYHPDICANFSTARLRRGYIITKTELNSISNKKDNNVKLASILELISLILHDVLILHEKLFTHFCNLQLYYESVESTLLNLLGLVNKRLQIIILESEKRAILHEECRNKADVAAHRLLGCCQDGTCGSLNGKKLEKKNKKASKKKKKSDKKLELGVYAKEDELENIDQPESNDERQLKNFDQNSHEESNYIQNKDLRGNQVGYSKDILIDSINLTTRVLGILSSIFELEINLHNLISKSKILYKYLLKERVRNYESSKKNRLNILLRESLKYVNLDFAQDQKYDQRNNLLKCCSLYEGENKNESGKNDFCFHCKCKECDQKQLKHSIYSID